jgi:hypothetical protein
MNPKLLKDVANMNLDGYGAYEQRPPNLGICHPLREQCQYLLLSP